MRPQAGGRDRAAVRPASILIAVLITGGVAVPQAQRSTTPAPQDPEAAARAALARPIDAGSIPFLIPHARFSNVAGRLASALGHERADVRAVAARAIFVIAGRSYGGAVAKALPVEQDPIAGAEMVRALMAIRGAEADADAIAAASRLGAPAIQAVIVTLAHTRPLDVLPHLEDLNVESAVLADALLRAIAADAGRVARAFEALPADTDLAALSTMFTRARDVGLPLPAEIVEPSLRRGATRRDVLAYLLDRAEALPPAVLKAVRAAPVPAADDAWDAVHVELIARGQPGASRRDIRKIVPTLDRGLVPARFWRSPALARLTPEELRDLRTYVLGRETADAAGPGGGGTSRPSRDPRWSATGDWRSADPLPGLDAAVAAAAGCRPGPGEIGVMQITYGPRGQVSAVKVAAPSGSPACREAAAMLAVLEVAPIAERAPVARTDHIVSVFTRETLECEGRSARASRTRSVDDAPGMVAPRKLRDVPPVYPKELIAARVQGRVVIESVVERSGCVARSVVLEAAHPQLNVAALAAVAQWRYTPTTLNGETVAVIMTMTSTFSLK
jgi:TonB family protein